MCFFMMSAVFQDAPDWSAVFVDAPVFPHLQQTGPQFFLMRSRFSRFPPGVCFFMMLCGKPLWRKCTHSDRVYAFLAQGGPGQFQQNWKKLVGRTQNQKNSS